MLFRNLCLFPLRHNTLILLNKPHDSWVSKEKPPLSNVSLQSMGTNDRNNADAHIQAVKNGGRGIKASQGGWMAHYRLPALYRLSFTCLSQSGQWLSPAEVCLIDFHFTISQFPIYCPIYRTHKVVMRIMRIFLWKLEFAKCCALALKKLLFYLKYSLYVSVH